MSDHTTKRDACWDALIKQAINNGTGGFYLRDTYDDLDIDINYATFRRTARGMQATQWLGRPTQKAQRWFADTKAELLFPIQPNSTTTIQPNTDKATKRDACWNVLLTEIAHHGRNGLLLKDVHERTTLDVNYATLRRTARGMEALGWLSRRSKKAQRWYPGDKAERLLATITSSNHAAPNEHTA